MTLGVSSLRHPAFQDTLIVGKMGNQHILFQVIKYKETKNSEKYILAFGLHCTIREKFERYQKLRPHYLDSRTKYNKIQFKTSSPH